MFWMSLERVRGPVSAGAPPGGRAATLSRKLRRVSVAAVALALVSALCSGCGGSAVAVDANPYTIGLVTSQTGNASQLGVGELRGAQLAVDTVNKAGGINGHKVSLRVADDQSNPSQTVLATRRLLSQTSAVVGPSVAGACNAAAPLATSAGRVNYCLSPGIRPEPGSTTWSASASTEDLAERLVEYWRHRGITRIGLLHTTDASGIDGGEALRTAVRKTPGMKLTGSGAYSPKAISVTPQLQSATAGSPQAVVVWASGAAAGVAFKGLHESGNTLPVATTDANLTFAFMERIKDYVPETLLIPATRDFWGDKAGSGFADRVRRYQESYRARYHEAPDFGPGVAYDAVMLVTEALRQAEGDPAKAVQALEQLGPYDGILGTYSFGAADHRGLTVDDVAVVRATTRGFTYAGR
ncbi:ABC transporter substrate-binding protein [Streptomyces sp. NPDC059909]|uniref:ABC transporter substrate-binding protein n=1 Tax=Streptomyces sp. NPDC059909 TaxID=3346998 RepID=UPI003650D2E4